jgi:hypothetical protein
MPKAPPKVIDSIRTRARKFACVEESIACKGTPIESASFKINKKAFLFLRPAQLMVKLRESLPDASKRAADSPDTLQAGASGWVTAKLNAARSVPVAVLERWVDESYRLFSERAPSRAARSTVSTKLPVTKKKTASKSK